MFDDVYATDDAHVICVRRSLKQTSELKSTRGDVIYATDVDMRWLADGPSVNYDLKWFRDIGLRMRSVSSVAGRRQVPDKRLIVRLAEQM